MLKLRLTNIVFKQLKIIKVIIVSALFTACTSTPTHLIVAPVLTAKNTNVLYQSNLQLQVTDLRIANHVVQISKEGQAATVLSAQQSLDEIVANTLKEHWQGQGLNFTTMASKSMTIVIKRAMIRVKQELLSYQADSEIIIVVKIDNGKKVLTSTFKSTGNSEGPLQADIAVLERDFNDNLSTVLQQILSSKKIFAFLQ